MVTHAPPPPSEKYSLTLVEFNFKYISTQSCTYLLGTLCYEDTHVHYVMFNSDLAYCLPTQLLFFEKSFFFNYVYVGAQSYAHVHKCIQRLEKGVRLPGARVTDGCELSCVCTETKLKEHYALLTAGACIQHHV